MAAAIAVAAAKIANTKCTFGSNLNFAPKCTFDFVVVASTALVTVHHVTTYLLLTSSEWTAGGRDRIERVSAHWT